MVDEFGGYPKAERDGLNNKLKELAKEVPVPQSKPEKHPAIVRHDPGFEGEPTICTEALPNGRERTLGPDCKTPRR